MCVEWLTTGWGMALIACRECGNQVSEGARSCPRCGAPVLAEANAGIDLSSVRFKSGSSKTRAGTRRDGTGFVAGFERNVLFRIARFVAFTICFTLFMAMVVGLVYIGTSFNGASSPDPAQVVQSLKPGAANTTPGGIGSSQSSNARPSVGAQSPLIGIQLPPALQEWTTDESNRQVLESWLSGFEQKDRQPFIDKLANVVHAARLAGVDESEAVNSYYVQYESYLSERETRRLSSATSRLYAAGAVISILLMLALFSLVLVLLAIERNTYRMARED